MFQGHFQPNEKLSRVRCSWPAVLFLEFPTTVRTPEVSVKNMADELW